jgi:hypothetical protein
MHHLLASTDPVLPVAAHRDKKGSSQGAPRLGHARSYRLYPALRKARPEVSYIHGLIRHRYGYRARVLRSQVTYPGKR